MALAKEKVYTIEDIYELQDGQRAELIEGQIYYMAPPSSGHQRIISRLTQKILNYIDRNGGDCEVFPAPFAVFLNKDKWNYVEPDISVICDKSKIDERGCNGAPDWVIEIVSPSSRTHDYMTKLFHYQKAGVREYWIVDQAKNRITVYSLEQNSMMEYSFMDKVKVAIYEDLEIDFSELLKPVDK